MTETKNMGNPDFDLLFTNDTIDNKNTKEYQELCEKHGYRIVVTPTYIARDDGTFSTKLQHSIGKIPKNA